MEPQIALTPKQMEELKSLGLDCSDASMCWCQDPNEDEYRLFIHDEYCYEAACLHPVPAYTLEDILMKLPNTFEVECSDSGDTWYYDLVIFPNWNSELWHIRYKNRFGDLTSVAAKNIMKSAFEMLKWVLQNYPDKIKKI